MTLPRHAPPAPPPRRAWTAPRVTRLHSSGAEASFQNAGPDGPYAAS